MVFSSTIFLFFFLPLVLTGYFLAAPRWRNTILLCASLLFYYWGENIYVLVMLFSIVANYAFGLLIDRAQRQGKRGRTPLIFAVAVNLGLLGFYKYTNFLIDNGNILLVALHLPPVVAAPIHLPIGISFFTFQALSYIIDLYRFETTVQRNLLDFALYKSLFPQLIAGPIVRYKDVATEIVGRKVTLDDLGYGVQRFIIGLGKKVLIANVMGRAADTIFALPPETLPIHLAWLGAIAYTLQIYYDFSGYSDMAIGLGRMFGFHFLENFNYPYISTSIREFWRRWHISLSSWFRDYLYIPLGGSRLGTLRTSGNLLLVFFLCGFWHGASWTFLFWGGYHGFFLALERTAPGRRVFDLMPAVLRHIYVILVVVIGWVFFRAETLAHALAYLRAMADFTRPPLFNSQIFLAVNSELYITLILAAIGSAPVFASLRRWWAAQQSPASQPTGPMRYWTAAAAQIGSLGFVLVYSIACIMGGAHNPFLYFRF